MISRRVKTFILTFSLAFPPVASAQQDSLILGDKVIEELQLMIVEVLVNNPEIQAAAHQMDVMEAKVPQARALDDPRLQYMRMEMPGFRWNEATYANLELMQMVRFPTKLSTQGRLADIRAEHAHHDHIEKVNEVITRLKSAYNELWFVQQNIALNRENARLLKQFSTIAQTKYAVGEVTQQDVLKAQVELSKLTNEGIALRQQELSTKAMLMAILNRAPKDTLGYAVIRDEVTPIASLDSLESFALQNRSMLKHDSLGVDESRTELSLAKQEYIPDFQFSLERVTGPVDGFRGWTVRAGLSIPFVPWTLGKASARVEEANAAIRRSTAMYQNSKNMVLSTVKDSYYKAEAEKRQLDTYRASILPQARQTLEASRASYQTGRSDFLMLIDAYRTLVDLTEDYFMTRMQFEQTKAELERAVGLYNVERTK